MQLPSYITKILCKFDDYFPTKYRRKQKWVFFIETLCSENVCLSGRHNCNKSKIKLQ